MSESNIGWTKYSWNPYTWNCTKVSLACKNCYMFEMARNLRGKDATGAPQLREAAWAELRRFESGPVFVNSMSDTYHEDVPTAWIHRIHNTARQHPHLIFLLLTKRIERAAALAPYLDWPRNLWIGTTVESDEYLWRLDYLRSITQAAGRFVSFEPLLGLVTPNLTGIEWVIVGGESGNRRRFFDRFYAMPILYEAQRKSIPFFFKQGSHRLPGRDRLFRGQEWNEIPAGWNWTSEHKVSTTPAPQQMSLFEEIAR